MSDFENAHNRRCPICGTWYCDVEGFQCDCYSYKDCKGCEERLKIEELDDEGYCEPCAQERGGRG